MKLTVRDDESRYVIECPDACEVKLNRGGCDYLVVPDPEGPLWLFDGLLIESARAGQFGLRLISEAPLAEKGRGWDGTIC